MSIFGTPNHSTRPLIQLQDISHTYREKCILSHISLAIYGGDVSILRGPSGSGKSTFLRILSGIDRPSSGTVQYRKNSTQDNSFSEFYRNNIGVFFTDSVFFGSSTARENIMFPSLFGGYNFSQDIFDECTSLFEIENFLDTSMMSLSSGERERIALVRMLVSKPEILILDEPFSHLDERLYTIALEYLSRYITTHHATLWVVTHDRGFTLDGANEYHLDGGSLIRL